MNVLVGCEMSGIVREAFRSRGHNAWSCDIEPALDGSPYHFQQDVREVIGNTKLGGWDLAEYGWDLAIFHPPCTYLANSGVSWFNRVPVKPKKGVAYGDDRWIELFNGGTFFRQLLDADIPRIAVENPIPHKYALDYIGRRPDQIVQPNWFGEPYRKATCLWLKNLPKLVPTKMIPRDQCKQKCWLESPSKQRALLRSLTYPGIADAMASQWGAL